VSDKLLVEERKNNNNNNNNKKRSKHNMSPKFRLVDILSFSFRFAIVDGCEQLMSAVL
jgi:hypothetical protein